MTIRSLLPRMFHRRLLLLFGGAVLVAALLTTRLFRVTVVQGAVHRSQAEARLNERTYIPTIRGRILDRRGEVLAVDRPCFDVAVDYEVISGAWAINRAVEQARDEIGSAAWDALGPEARQAMVDERLPHWERRVEGLWETLRASGGITRDELDGRLDRIRRHVESLAGEVWSNQRAAFYAKYGRPAAGEADGFDARPIREQKSPHVVLPRVPDRVAFSLMQRAEALPGVQVIHSGRREYPWSTRDVVVDRSTLPREIRSEEPLVVRVDGIADHVVGSMRGEVWAEDIERRPFIDPATGKLDRGGYRVGDAVGRSGLELVFEDHLRGLRGVVDRRLDTGEERITPREPGKDLHLTLDARLQTRVQALLSPEVGLTRVQQWQAGWNSDGTPRETALPIGTDLRAAAVVLDVDTGEILALVSSPSIAEGEAMDDAARAAAHPYVNRPIETPYPPGSIIKPLVLAAAVGEGVHRLDRRIECTGHYFDDKNVARCWIYRAVYGYSTHTAQLGGPLDAVDAIARSCNIYFYTLAHARLGMAPLLKWYHAFGMGEPFNVGLLHERPFDREVTREVRRADGAVETVTETKRVMLPVGESGGDLPSAEDISLMRREGRLEFATAIAGIGQGPITWTPLHAAYAYSVIARGGRQVPPRLIRNDPRPDGGRRLRDVRIDPPVVRAILEGLRQSVEEAHGTGHAIRYADRTSEPIINAESVTVWAKTGTAEAPPLKVIDPQSQDGERWIKDLDHAWFVGLVGSGDEHTARPQFAIAVVVEYGGSGGRTAGPVANQIIRALQAEGYL